MTGITAPGAESRPVLVEVQCRLVVIQQQLFAEGCQARCFATTGCGSHADPDMPTQPSGAMGSLPSEAHDVEVGVESVSGGADASEVATWITFPRPAYWTLLSAM